ncbi:aspartokinase [Formosa agariphila KMM 3901]|uniref:Aspartokinase n=1 Tax=Formosa agariphila (strain DSM 15362 / KCTC 12365 / LMG 23005 / KMM 3901 / M-2Alg 35-1) TaxID=1347342 RepID=T2KRA5_FORAG|nr:aspartate kinase [Formosa agariphila]CDF80986.1 aspartokinase [Formosa agariphila KMM 3901]
MLVLKFGGTSVGSVENMTNVKSIVSEGGRKVVVLSAMSGTTNALVEISHTISEGKSDEALSLIETLYNKYIIVINDLFSKQEFIDESLQYIDSVFGELRALVSQPSHKLLYNITVSKGELLSTFMFSRFLQQDGVKATLISAFDFMRTDRLQEPDSFYIKRNLTRVLEDNKDTEVFITQGFICLDADGDISNLERGGSDFTASIIGAAVQAEEVQIWTDIDGFHNNDPRFVHDTDAISHLSFDEAAELAYFGAKILHPQTVMPVRDLKIPVRIKNTMDPAAHGTLIDDSAEGEGIKAIAAIDGITAIKIKSARMLQASGFLKKVFEIFEKYHTSIDMITTSEIAVSLTIDDATYLKDIVAELEEFSNVSVDTHRTIVCVVGNNIVNHPDTHKLFQILQDINIRMISYGGSNNNISLLINTSDKLETLQKLHRYVFDSVTV